MKKSAFIVAAALAVAACGENSASVGAGSGSDTSAENGSTISKVKSVFAGSEAAAAVKMPAYMLIGEAIFDGKDAGRMGRGAREVGVEGAGQLDVTASLLDVLIAMKDTPEWGGAKAGLDRKVAALIERGASKEEIEKQFERVKWEGKIAACVAVSNGWEYDPISERKQAEEYMRFMATSCDFANAIYSYLVASIGTTALKDEAAAREKITALWQEYPLEKVKAEWDSAAKMHARAAYVPDLAGTKDLRFTSPAAQYVNDGSGFVVKKNGAQWFGAGYISGKAFELSLMSAAGSKMEKTKDINSGTSSAAGSKTGADIGVK